MVLKKLKPEMTVWDVRKNTEFNFERHFKWHTWPVYIYEVDEENDRVCASWNCNPKRWFYRNQWSKWRLNRPSDKTE